MSINQLNTYFEIEMGMKKKQNAKTISDFFIIYFKPTRVSMWFSIKLALFTFPKNAFV